MACNALMTQPTTVKRLMLGLKHLPTDLVKLLSEDAISTHVQSDDGDDKSVQSSKASDVDSTANTNNIDNDNIATATRSDASDTTVNANSDNNSTIDVNTYTTTDDVKQSEVTSLRGSAQDVCRPLTKSEALNVVWTVYPPPATGLPARESRWIRPLVDGEEAWSLLGASALSCVLL